MNFLKIFCWTKVHFVGPLIVPILDFVWPSPWVFKARVVLSPAHLLACMRVNSRIMSGSTPAFPTNAGVHYIKHVYSRSTQSQKNSLFGFGCIVLEFWNIIYRFNLLNFNNMTWDLKKSTLTVACFRCRTLPSKGMWSITNLYLW